MKLAIARRAALPLCIRHAASTCRMMPLVITKLTLAHDDAQGQLAKAAVAGHGTWPSTVHPGEGGSLLQECRRSNTESTATG